MTNYKYKTMARRYDVPLSDAEVEIHSNLLFEKSGKVKDTEREVVPECQPFKRDRWKFVVSS